MIRNLRNSGIGQIFLGAIVVAIILAFVLTGTSATGGLSGDECAVEVGDTCVSPKEFFAAYGLLSAVGPGGINEAAASRFRLKEQVARGLAERSVLLEEARRLGIGTSEDDIDDELVHGRTRVSLPADDQIRLAASLGMCVPGPGGCELGTVGLRSISVTQDGEFNFDVYKRSVRIWTKRSPSHFKEMQEREYTAERVRQLVKSQVRVSPEEAFLAYSRIRSQATARTVALPTAWFQRYVTRPSEERVAAYEKEHEKELDAALEGALDQFEPGCGMVSELVVHNSDPNAEEARDAKKKAQALRQKAMSGEDFHALAARESDAQSAKFGGRVGCITTSYGAGSAVLSEAAKELTRPGQVSPVLETIQGFVVLRLEERVTEENRKELVRAHLAQKQALSEMAQEDAKQFGEKLIEMASGQPLEEALSKLLDQTLGDDDHPAKQASNVPKVEISRAVTVDQEPFTGASTEIPPSISLFELEKEDALFPTPIPTTTGFTVMQLKEKDMLTKEEFEEDRADVIATLTARKAQEALADYVAELIKKRGGVKINEKYVPPADDDQSSKEQDS